MVSWASGGLGHDTVEPQCRQIQFVDERFNNPDRVVLRHVVIQAVRQQRSLPPVLAFHKTFHPAIPNSRTLNYHVRAFHTPSGMKTSSRDQRRASVLRSVRRPSPEDAAMRKMRRKRAINRRGPPKLAFEF